MMSVRGSDVRRKARGRVSGAAGGKVAKTQRRGRSASAKWVYLFAEGNAGMKALLGGKGANLGEMTRLGLPVPPGFIVTTEACNAYLAEGGAPSGLWAQVRAALAALERATDKRFGDPERPLLVSCRSGAKFSMPGMMDTVLNLGLNDTVVEGLAKLTGDARFAFDSYRRLLQMFGTVVLGLADEPFEAELAKYRGKRGVANDADLEVADLKAICEAFKALVRKGSGKPFPEDPWQQLEAAVGAVFRSWNGKRAIDYRNASGIAHDLGTAVNIQTMVFGNLGEDSATGVVTTRDVTTGEPEIEGDWLLNAQGEDVVAGTRATSRIATLARAMPRIWSQFTRACAKLERHCGDVQDVEFTIERGKLWLLQTRDAKRTAQAAVRIAVDLANERRISRAAAVQRVTPEQVDYFLHPQFPPAVRKAARASGALIASGLNVSPGAASGVLAFDADTAERWSLDREEGGDHGAAGDQAGRRPRHAGGARHPHLARRAHQPRGAGGPAVRQAGGGRGHHARRRSGGAAAEGG